MAVYTVWKRVVEYVTLVVPVYEVDVTKDLFVDVRDSVEMCEVLIEVNVLVVYMTSEM